MQCSLLFKKINRLTLVLTHHHETDAIDSEADDYEFKIDGDTAIFNKVIEDFQDENQEVIENHRISDDEKQIISRF